MSDKILVYMTAGSMEEARTLARTIIYEKLAACVNVLDNMESWFMWEGEVQNDNEVVVLAKTTTGIFPDLVDKVKTVHSYDCPCIVSLSINDGNTDFLAWIGEEVKKTV